MKNLLVFHGLECYGESKRSPEAWVSERPRNLSHPMGLINLIRGELIEIIEWIDDSRDTLAWRFPDDDKAIKNGAQLIVRESQVAQLVMTGAIRGYVLAGQAYAQHAQCPGAGTHPRLEIRLRLPFQGGCLFCLDPPVHRQQVGHFKPCDDAGPGFWRRAAASLRDLRFQGGKSSALPERGRWDGSEFPSSTSLPIRCARGWSARSAMHWPPPRSRLSMWPAATASWARH